jgi:hypothetical protein
MAELSSNGGNSCQPWLKGPKDFPFGRWKRLRLSHVSHASLTFHRIRCKNTDVSVLNYVKFSLLSQFSRCIRHSFHYISICCDCWGGRGNIPAKSNHEGKMLSWRTVVELWSLKLKWQTISMPQWCMLSPFNRPQYQSWEYLAKPRVWLVQSRSQLAINETWVVNFVLSDSIAFTLWDFPVWTDKYFIIPFCFRWRNPSSLGSHSMLLSLLWGFMGSLRCCRSHFRSILISDFTWWYLENEMPALSDREFSAILDAFALWEIHPTAVSTVL